MVQMTEDRGPRTETVIRRLKTGNCRSLPAVLVSYLLCKFKKKAVCD